MRPLSIELEGFFAYRKRAFVDLSDVDYFSLEGSTGSGKSSLIDAMIFALYGKIPRLGGNTVAPAISAGADRARVSLRFLANDVAFTATRQLERTATGGARATEVRLEGDGAVIASGSADVTPEIARLLNLSYEDFTRTVVLPQGEFARFLTATPKERQELLRGLLGLDVYRTMGALARNREQVARSELTSASGRLDELTVPTETEQQKAADRLHAIVDLAGQIDGHEVKIKELDDRLGDLAGQLEKVSDARERLERLAAPPNLEELSALLGQVSDQAEAHRSRLQQIEERHLDAIARVKNLTDTETLRRFSGLYDRLAAIDTELEAFDLTATRGRLADAEAGVVAAGAALERARQVQEDARSTHAAHDLARHIEPGHPCPVCSQIVESAPEALAPVDLEAADARVADATAALDKARKSVAELATSLAREEAAHDQLVIKRKELSEDLRDAPAREDVPDLVEKFEDASRMVTDLEEEKRQLGGLIVATEEKQAQLSEQQRSLGKTLMGEREKLADLKPAIAESEDVLIQWKELLSWRDVRLSEVAVNEKGLREDVEAARAALSRASSELTQSLASLGIDASGRSPSVAVARAEEQAKQTVKEQQAVLEQAGRLRREAEAATEKAAVAESLARHLRADGFERWMMVGAIADLVSGANSILDELSRSSYSLHSDEEGSFDIVDHRNADEIRPVATLSGGETFLVSLALALSLAETLAAGGGSKLDAIILDEGFGTLDEESLDVVASVLESLTMSGLMVGIITHVKALASRAPVRFVVAKGPDGSRVEAVE